jgi:hypothetical protein
MFEIAISITNAIPAISTSSPDRTGETRSAASG